MKIMIANRENGVSPAGDKNSKDPDGLSKAVAVVGAMSGSAELKDQVQKCVNTAQVRLTDIAET